MKLTIDKIAKIDHAEIEFDGVTVIAGSNNTGKSTLGKVLFAIFNSLNNIDDKVLDIRCDEIRDTIEPVLRASLGRSLDDRGLYWRKARRLSESIAKGIKSSIVNESSMDLSIHDLVATSMQGQTEVDLSNEELNDIEESIKTILDFPEDKFFREIVERTFNGVFNHQINRLSEKSSIGEIRLQVKEKDIYIQFEDNRCTELKADIIILHKVLLLGDPYIIDQVTTTYRGNYISGFMKSWLRGYRDENGLDGMISAIQAKERLAEVNALLNEMIPGNVVEKEGQLFLSENKGEGELLVDNLSTGIKSVFVLKQLLEKGAIVAKDVLVFDEPEIHLHPEWQVLYARIIALLGKAFDLTVVVTTHSPYFLYAMEKYINKYGLGKESKYYMSGLQGQSCSFSDVSEELEPIYATLAKPFQMLENIDD